MTTNPTTTVHIAPVADAIAHTIPGWTTVPPLAAEWVVAVADPDDPTPCPCGPRVEAVVDPWSDEFCGVSHRHHPLTRDYPALHDTPPAALT